MESQHKLKINQHFRLLLLSVGLVTSLAARCVAQTSRQTANLLVVDFAAPGTRHTDTLGNLVRDAVAAELKQGLPDCHLIERPEMAPLVKSLGLRLPVGPLTPTEFTDADWKRLAVELKAHDIVSGEIRSLYEKNRVKVIVNFIIKDTRDGEIVNGGYAQKVVEPSRGESDDDALRRTAALTAQDAARDMLQRKPVTTTIFSVRGNSVIIGNGRRDGIKNGDEFIVYRYTTQGYVKSGRIRISHVNETQSDAQVVQNSGISPEDTAHRAYRPETTVK